MQALTNALRDHLAQEVTTLATCWMITRRDGVRQYFTDHDADLTIDGAHYLAAMGMVPSAVTSQLGMAVDNLEIEGMLSAEGIAGDALLQGLYDHAELRVFMVNYQAPDEGMLHVKTGWLGEVTLRDGQFVVEVRGISAALQQQIGEVYSPTCRAALGDARCKVNLTAHTVMGSVTSVESVYAFRDSARTDADGTYSFGTITFTSGSNAGRSMEVREFADGRFALFLPMPSPLQPGDQYRVGAGCDKRFDTCVSRYGNALNFRGEPHVPGAGKLFETSSTRNSL